MTKQLSKMGLIPSSPRAAEEPEAPQEEKVLPPMDIPPVPHKVYGLYWLNDNSVAVVLSDRNDETKSRILAINIHGGFDWISLPYRGEECIFQQVKQVM